MARLARLARLALLLLVAPSLSCSAASGEDDLETVAAPVASDSADAAAAPAALPLDTAAAPAERDDEDGEAILPAGTYASLDALCAAQRAAAEPRLDAATAQLAERGVDDVVLRASCEVDGGALSAARVRTGGAFLAIAAVTYETGYATKSSLVVRTHDGWIPFAEASVSEYHDDPGCPSIVRDDGVTEVRVERDRLVVVDRADAGFGDGTIVYTRARSCALDDAARAFTCTTPVTIAVDLDEKPLFATTFRVGVAGEIEPAKTFDESALTP